MFVATGARKVLVDERTEGFAHAYIAPLLAEASRLRLEPNDVIRLITEHAALPTDQPAHLSPQEVG